MTTLKNFIDDKKFKVLSTLAITKMIFEKSSFNHNMLTYLGALNDSRVQKVETFREQFDKITELKYHAISEYGLDLVISDKKLVIKDLETNKIIDDINSLTDIRKFTARILFEFKDLMNRSISSIFQKLPEITIPNINTGKEDKFPVLVLKIPETKQVSISYLNELISPEVTVQHSGSVCKLTMLKLSQSLMTSQIALFKPVDGLGSQFGYVLTEQANGKLRGLKIELRDNAYINAFDFLNVIDANNKSLVSDYNHAKILNIEKGFEIDSLADLTDIKTSLAYIPY